MGIRVRRIIRLSKVNFTPVIVNPDSRIHTISSAMDTTYPIDQDPTYPIGWNGFINAMKPELISYELFKGFSTQNV